MVPEQEINNWNQPELQGNFDEVEPDPFVIRNGRIMARIPCSEPNIQKLDKRLLTGLPGGVRSMYTPPTGMVMCEPDFSKIEKILRKWQQSTRYLCQQANASAMMMQLLAEYFKPQKGPRKIVLSNDPLMRAIANYTTRRSGKRCLVVHDDILEMESAWSRRKKRRSSRSR